MIKEIEKYEFLTNQNNNIYKYYLGRNQGEGRNKYFEIQISPITKIGVFSNGLSTPKLDCWNEKYIISINNEVHIFDKMTTNLLKSYTLMGPIYEIDIHDNYLYIFAEIDIIVLNKELHQVYRTELKDVLSNYKITKNILNYSTMDGESFEQLIQE